MSITASQVKELREKTGVGMMDAKKALVENGGDMDASVDWLRTKGMAKAAKKAGRTAAEGLVAIATSEAGTTGAVVELNSETDFVARNEKFQAFASKIAEISVGVDGVDGLTTAAYADGKSVGDTLTDMVATIGENMQIRRMEKLSVSKGYVASYVHNALSVGLGKIGVLVALESEGDKEKLASLGKQIAMHVAAANPEFLDVNSVDPEIAEREKAVLMDQAAESGKPKEIIEKMIEGRMRKYFEEICLVEQKFVIDGETKIADVIKGAEKDIGATVKLTGYLRFVLGDGIEKEEEDFAAEVAKTVNG
jgi:elongation factor Ts|tara:strand:- start:72442 stop:73365 length:924 start_codon:yes stop_codon:yes gene_type:complete